MGRRYKCCLITIITIIAIIIRPHHLHAVHKMRPIAVDVACSVVCESVSVCALVTRMCCAKPGELIEMPFRRRTLVGPRNHLLNGVKIGRIIRSHEG